MVSLGVCGGEDGASMTRLPANGSSVGAAANAVGNSLRSRGPGWLAVPAGLVAAGAFGGAVLGAVALLLKIALPPPVLFGAAGFFGAALGLAALLSPRRQYTAAQLFSTFMGVGHCLLMASFAYAMLTPQGLVWASTAHAMLPTLPFMHANGDPLMVVGPVYITVFTLFSVFAPFSLIIFRYISLTSRS